MQHSTGDPAYPSDPTPEEMEERVSMLVRNRLESWRLYWSHIVDAMMREEGLTKTEAIIYVAAIESANLTNALNRAMNMRDEEE